MNIRAKSVNMKCAAFDVEKSVFVGQLMGFGAPNERMKCPACGELMKTTKNVNTFRTGRPPTRETSRHAGRAQA